MQFEKIMQSEMRSDNEIAGVNELSVLSAILSMNNIGVNLSTIRSMKLNIDSISATLWGMLPLAFAAKNEDKNAKDMLASFKVQLEKCIAEHLELIERIMSEIH